MELWRHTVRFVGGEFTFTFFMKLPQDKDLLWSSYDRLWLPGPDKQEILIFIEISCF
jgi:hypothetical protein